MKVDDSFNLGIGKRGLRSERGSGIMVENHGAGGRGVLRELVGQPHPAQAGCAIAKEVPSGGVLKVEVAH